MTDVVDVIEFRRDDAADAAKRCSKRSNRNLAHSKLIDDFVGYNNRGETGKCDTIDEFDDGTTNDRFGEADVWILRMEDDNISGVEAPPTPDDDKEVDDM